MKRYFMYSALFFGLTFGSCKTISTTVSFENKRTPLNPLAHRGVDQYNPAVVLTYREEVEQQKSEHQAEVNKITAQYEADLAEFQSKSIAERELLGLTPPKLRLPEEPAFPYLYNEEELAKKIAIEGMEKGNQNALEIYVQYEPLEFDTPKLNTNTRKRKKDEVEYVDTLYSYSVRIKQPVSIYAVSPLGDEYLEYVSPTTNWSNVRGASVKDSVEAFDHLLGTIEAREKRIGHDHIQHVNNDLNSQFGTVNLSYRVTLYSRKPSNKYNYDDLDQAKTHAERGLHLLLKNKNQGIEELNKAYVIWTEAAKEHNRSGKGRINHKVMRGILKNLIIASIFTENWDAVDHFIREIEKMKLSGSDKREVRYLKNKYNDLKARYDALKLD